MKTSQDFNENFNQYSSEQYKQAQKLANEIKDMAGTDRWNNNSYFDIAFNALGQFISKGTGDRRLRC